MAYVAMWNASAKSGGSHPGARLKSEAERRRFVLLWAPADWEIMGAGLMSRSFAQLCRSIRALILAGCARRSYGRVTTQLIFRNRARWL